MKCCRSCKYWDLASKKVPIDALKVIDKDNYIIIKLGNKEAKIPSWKWIPKDMSKYYLAKYMRVCFYGKGIVTPWDECQYFEGKYGDEVLCKVSRCEFAEICPKFKKAVAPYIT